jgi:hypothetical protein
MKTPNCFERLKPRDILHFRNGARASYICQDTIYVLVGHDDYILPGWSTTERYPERDQYPLLREYSRGYWYSKYAIKDEVVKVVRPV